MRLYIVPLILTVLFFFTTRCVGAVTFSDSFESPLANLTYTLANTSGTTGPGWVRSTSGFAASRHGVVREDRPGEAFIDPLGNQAYAFRYSSNTGITTANGSVGTLTAGQTITVSFNVLRDNYNGNDYSNYNASLVLFSGNSPRNSVTSPNNNTSAILAQSIGSATSNSIWTAVTFSYLVGNTVIDNNGATAGVSTAWNPALLGQDIALRFAGQGNGALIDNVSIDISTPVIPEPSVFLLSAVGLLLLTRRKR